MTIVRHELKRGRTGFIIWTSIIGFMLAVCIFIYPQMKGQMDDFGDIFASMGSFTEAFGMDRLNFGTLLGYYAIECGNVLGLGGAFYAALCAVSSLSKEEKERTAEFLLTHPVSRVRIVTEKLISVVIRILALNAIVFAVSVLSMAATGEAVPWKELCLIHIAYLLLQLEIAGVCFGISAFTRGGSVGLGLGIAAVAYFMNIIANLTDQAKFLKYVTPYGYCEGADIIENCSLDWPKVAIGAAICAAGVIAAYLKYPRKDIR
ncbi:MAG: ABC transporter permease subunit [Clostridia bacterium]|nr:ABC transporter permease subunit [Clostridia bacterium]